MSSNPYINYYVNQAGSGIGGFQGARFQRGQGFFGNVFKSAILPLLRYLGPKILSSGVSAATDAIGGDNFLESLKTRGKATAQQVASDAGERAMRFAQTGRGKRRRRVKSRRIMNSVKSQLGTGRRRKRKRNIRNASKKGSGVGKFLIEKLLKNYKNKKSSMQNVVKDSIFS